MRRTIPIPYYTSTLELHVEEENLKAVLTAKMHGFHAEKSQEQLVLDALEHPVGRPACESWRRAGGRSSSLPAITPGPCPAGSPCPFC